MFEVVPTPEAEAELSRIAELAGRERVALRYPAGYTGRWLRSLLEMLRSSDPGLRFVRVPTEPDRVERVLLELARAGGADGVRAVAERLRAEPDRLSATLLHLDAVLGSTRLVVDGWSALRVTDDTYDAGHAQDARLAGVRDWLAGRARMIVDCDFSPPESFSRQTLAVTSTARRTVRSRSPRPSADIARPSSTARERAVLVEARAHAVLCGQGGAGARDAEGSRERRPRSP